MVKRKADQLDQKPQTLVLSTGPNKPLINEYVINSVRNHHQGLQERLTTTPLTRWHSLSRGSPLLVVLLEHSCSRFSPFIGI